MRISHEAIYQALYAQSRGALRPELTACLRTGRALRVPRARSRGRGKPFIAPEIMISQRPAEAADRAVPGHREGDPRIAVLAALLDRQPCLDLGKTVRPQERCAADTVCLIASKEPGGDGFRQDIDGD